MRLCASLLLLLCCALPAPVRAEVHAWQVVTDHDGTELSFHSKATLESFGGKTGKLSGRIAFDPADLGSLEAEITADLASLDTGIGLRNKHMRDNVLHTEEHPVAVFVVEECDADTLRPGQEISTKVVGTMRLHGVQQRMEAPTTVRWAADGLLTLTAEFRIQLADYGIKRPKMLMLKVAEEVSVTVRAAARPSAALAVTPD